MKPRTLLPLCVAVALLVIAASPQHRVLRDATEQARVVDEYGRLRLSFEANRGQVADDVRFLSRGDGYTLFITAGEAVMRLRTADADDRVFRMRLDGANHTAAAVEGLREQPGRANYFIGKDPAQWKTGVPTYESVAVRDAYPGIDLVYYGNQRQLEYDFVVKAGADARAIQMTFAGADDIAIDRQGDAVLRIGDSDVRLRKPVAYQNVAGARRDVEVRFMMDQARHIGFDVGTYDRGAKLVIDPVLIYSTAFGGSHTNVATSVTVDSFGYAYVAGSTDSCDFPGERMFPGVPCGSSDVFVAKFDPAGSALVYAAIVGGGTSNDEPSGIDVDSLGQAYVTGSTYSQDFPTTPGAVQRERNLGLCAPIASNACSHDAFAFKLAPSGSSLAYSTFLGGSSHDQAHDIAVDAAGNAFIGGTTMSSDFPTVNAYQRQLAGPNNDAFVVKLNAAGSAFDYATLLGGSSYDVAYALAIDDSGHAYVAGITGSRDFPLTQGIVDESRGGEVFVTKLHDSGSSLVYSTHFGGSGFDEVHAMTVDSRGRAHLTGMTWSPDFPTRNALRPNIGDTTKLPTGWVGDAFVSTVNETGTDLDYSTYLGGTRPDLGTGIAVDRSGRIYVTGATLSVDFPVSADAMDSTCGTDGNCNVTNPSTTYGWYWDGFMVVLDPLVAGDASLVYGTYLGGRYEDWGYGVAVDEADDVYVVGYTGSLDFTTRSVGALTSSNRAFVTKFRMGGAPIDVSIGDALFAEGGSAGNQTPIHVTLSRASDRDLTVDYVTADGTAASGTDYENASGRLTIPAGQTDAVIALRARGDVVAEANEQFSVALSNPAVGAAVARGIGTITIVDDDRPALSIGRPAPVVEGPAGGATSVVFTLTLSAPAPLWLSVNYATSDGTARAGSDYLARSGAVVFAPGQITGTVQVPIIGDTAPEMVETFSLNAVFNPGASHSTTAAATIIDDDRPPRVDGFSPSEGRARTVVTITGLSFTAASEVRFDTCTAPFTILSDLQITAAVPAGVCSGPISVTTPGGTGVSATPFYVLPEIQVMDTWVNEGDYGTTPVVFRVTLSQPAPQTVTVRYTTVDATARAGSDYVATSGTLTFAPGQSSRVIAVPVINDRLDEPTEVFRLILSAPVNAVVTRSIAVGAIVDNDPWLSWPFD